MRQTGSRTGVWPRAALLVGVLILGGCAPRRTLEAAREGPEDVFAVEILDLFLAGQYTSVQVRTHEAVGHLFTLAKMAETRDRLPEGPSIDRQLVGFDREPGDTVRITLTYDLEFAGGYGLASLTLADRMGGLSLVALQVAPTEGSLSQRNAFTLKGRTVEHYTVLGMLLVSLGLSLGGLAWAIWARWLRRRWLWALAAILGVGQISFDWSTGEWAISPLAIVFFGAAVFRIGEVGPWVLYVGCPVGALVLLVNEMQRRRQKGSEWRGDVTGDRER